MRQRLANKFSGKQNQRPRFRAVLCAGDGSRTNGTVYADDDTKRVWFQFFGSGGIGRARCEKIVPELGLGVYVGRTDDGLEWQVLEDDPLLRQTATDARDYQSIAQNDLNPGGRLLLWADSRQLEPLATWDTPASLLVNVNTGYYMYGSSRKLFPGETDLDLTASVPGSANEWRLVGLYLDSSNTLLTVDGTAVSTAFNPPEPTWPAGAFRLAVVRLTNGQTEIDFANDVFDRRVLWSDENSGGGGGWPLTNVLTVSSTNAEADYSTFPDAIAGASAGDVILLDAETYTLTTGAGGFEISTSNLTIIGLGVEQTIITSAQNDVFTLDIRGDNVTFQNLSINWTGAGTAGAPLGGDGDNLRLIGCRLNKTSGAPTTAAGLEPYGGTGWQVIDTIIIVTSGTNKYGYYDLVASGVTFYGGSIQGDSYDVITTETGAVLTLNGTVLVNGLVNFAGILNWEPENKITKNLLGDTLSTINSWQTADTFNDIADDTYCGGLWNVVHNGQTPDITRQAGGSTDPFEYYFRCTFDSAASQAGIVQFLLARDTIPLRGQKVSLSFDAWGTAVVELRAAVISWGSTADTLTSDVVGTWATDNPTLATNWSYANTPAADITISSTRRRVTINNITVPSDSNNIAVFIWTSAEEASTDLFNIARVQLERGPVATEYVALNYLEELRRINTLMYVLGKITGSRTLGGRADGATVGFFGFQLPTEMRSVPTISLNNGSGNVRVNDGLVNVNVTAISTNFSTRTNIGVNLTTDTGLTSGRPIFVDFTDTTSFLLFDSRL